MVLLLGFITLIFVCCTKVSIVNNEYLIAGGKYFTHCIGVNSPGAIAGFEKMVSGLGVPVSVARTEGHVPSFMEKWVWCQVTRLEGDITEEVNGEAAAEPGPAEGRELFFLSIFSSYYFYIFYPSSPRFQLLPLQTFYFKYIFLPGKVFCCSSSYLEQSNLIMFSLPTNATKIE